MQFYRDIDPVDERDVEQQRQDEHDRRDAAQHRARVRERLRDAYGDDYFD